MQHIPTPFSNDTTRQIISLQIVLQPYAERTDDISLSSLKCLPTVLSPFKISVALTAFIIITLVSISMFEFECIYLCFCQRTLIDKKMFL